MRRTLALSLALASALSSACAVSSAHDDPETDAASNVGGALSAPDGAAILALVNYPGTDLAVLDRGAGLDARAAKAIVAARNGKDGVSPSADDAHFASIAALDAVAYVGDAAFTKLRIYAATHPAPAGETVEGVAFTGWESVAVAFGVNHADLAQLDKLMDARAAKALVDHRPYTTVTQMGPQSYVGGAALGALRKSAPSFWSAMHAAPPGCIATFDAAVRPHLADVLFLSESDREIQIVSYPGAGTTAPTAASVLALVGAPAGSTAQLRDVGNYYVDLEPSSGTADPGAAAAIQAAVTAQLHDVVYVAIFAPKGSIDQALVGVYLVGRTTCGDLVGLTSIAVET